MLKLKLGCYRFRSHNVPAGVMKIKQKEFLALKQVTLNIIIRRFLLSWCPLFYPYESWVNIPMSICLCEFRGLCRSRCIVIAFFSWLATPLPMLRMTARSRSTSWRVLRTTCNTRFIKEHKPSNHIRARIKSHVYTTEWTVYHSTYHVKRHNKANTKVIYYINDKMSDTAEAKYKIRIKLSEAEAGRHRDVDWETNT